MRHAYPHATYAGLDWIVQDDMVVRPDVMVVCGSQPDRHLQRPPSLAVEVLSDATADKDWTVKRPLYESTGVSHHLIVDPVSQTIEWLALGADGRYHDRSAKVPLAGRCGAVFDNATAKASFQEMPTTLTVGGSVACQSPPCPHRLRPRP